MAKEVTLYTNPTWSSCGKTKQLLGESDVNVTVVQVNTKHKPTETDVRAVAALLPGGIRDMVNVRGRKYRELGLAGKQLTDEELVILLTHEPGLWRKPIVVRGTQVVVGHNAESLQALLAEE